MFAHEAHVPAGRWRVISNTPSKNECYLRHCTLVKQISSVKLSKNIYFIDPLWPRSQNRAKGSLKVTTIIIYKPRCAKHLCVLITLLLPDALSDCMNFSGNVLYDKAHHQSDLGPHRWRVTVMFLFCWIIDDKSLSLSSTSQYFHILFASNCKSQNRLK